MRSAILALGLCILAFINARAQITLTSGSYPAAFIGTDTLRQTTYNSLFPPLAPTADGIWDMTVVTDTTPYTFNYRVPGAPYPFADSNYYYLGSWRYQGNVQYSLSSVGYLEPATNIRRSEYSLTTLTLGVLDSIFIPTQNMAYSSPDIKIAFPASYDSRWTSNYRSDFNFELSVSSYSLSHAPGILRTYTGEHDTVVGWGKMRVTNLSGLPSGYFDVLQVQTTRTTIDSFFLNGAPMSGIILAVLSLQQGHTDTIYEQNYYREHEVTPLAQIRFRDAGFTQPYSALTHAQRLDTVAVENAVQQLAETRMRVYPNPANQRVIFIDIPDPQSAYTYRLADMNGRIVSTGTLNGKHTGITLPAEVCQGVYAISVATGQGHIYTTSVTIAR